MKNNQLAALAILGGIAIYLTTQKRQPPRYNYYPAAPTAPPAPKPQTQRYLQWAMYIIGLFGAVKWLWEPGGPFYNSGIPKPDDPGYIYWQQNAQQAGGYSGPQPEDGWA